MTPLLTTSIDSSFDAITLSFKVSGVVLVSALLLEWFDISLSTFCSATLCSVIACSAIISLALSLSVAVDCSVASTLSSLSSFSLRFSGAFELDSKLASAASRACSCLGVTSTGFGCTSSSTTSEMSLRSRGTMPSNLSVMTCSLPSLSIVYSGTNCLLSALYCSKL